MRYLKFLCVFSGVSQVLGAVFKKIERDEKGGKYLVVTKVKDGVVVSVTRRRIDEKALLKKELDEILDMIPDEKEDVMKQRGVREPLGKDWKMGPEGDGARKEKIPAPSWRKDFGEPEKRGSMASVECPRPIETPRQDSPRPRPIETPRQDSPKPVETPRQDSPRPRPIETPRQDSPKPVETPRQDSPKPVETPPETEKTGKAEEEKKERREQNFVVETELKCQGNIKIRTTGKKNGDALKSLEKTIMADEKKEKKHGEAVHLVEGVIIRDGKPPASSGCAKKRTFFSIFLFVVLLFRV
ncbi:MAG: uncharacterized protein A8A55_1053 [Amphiamblys sp. WSBS2006]|nr:MAG: uncharacterized protein A8A55_1053 [Amphiamblys sp. WSBS2006]